VKHTDGRFSEQTDTPWQPCVPLRRFAAGRLAPILVVATAVYGVAFTGTASAAFTWTNATNVEANSAGGQWLTNVACISATVCVTLDQNGSEVTFNPSSPSGAAHHVVDPGQSLSAASCPSSSQCTATDAAGDEVTFNPNTGSVSTSANVATPNGGDGFVVSCPSTTQCTTAGDDGGPAATFNPQSPGTVTNFTLDTDGLGSGAIVCVSVTQCTVAPSGGQTIQTFNPQTSTDTNDIAITSNDVGFAYGMSCVSTTDCVAVGNNGSSTADYAAEFNPAAGTSVTETKLDSSTNGGIEGVSCASAAACTAVSYDGDEVAFNPSTQTVMTAATSIDTNHLSSVSCVTATMCVAADGSGAEVNYSPASPGAAAAATVDGADGLGEVACPTATSCVALEGSQAGRADDANVVAFNPQSPSASQPTQVIPGATSTPDGNSPIGLTAVACASSTVCVAVGYDATGSRVGIEATFNPASLGSATHADIPATDLFEAVACPSATECVAVDDNGDEATFDPADPAGGQVDYIDSENEFNDLNGISCPTVTQCTAVDFNGDEVTFNPADPGAATQANVHTDTTVTSYLTAVSCPTTTQCTASGADGDEVTFDPLAPASPITVSVNSAISAVVCVSIHDCLAPATNGQVFEGNPATTNTWVPTTVVDGDALLGIACASPNECVTVDSASDESSGTSSTIVPPVNTDPPAISGTAKQGTTLTASTGNWSNTPTSYGYQWQDCNAGGTGCSNITGATSGTYQVQASDVGHAIVVVVTASNGGGPGTAVASAPTAVAQAASTGSGGGSGSEGTGSGSGGSGGSGVSGSGGGASGGTPPAPVGSAAAAKASGASVSDTLTCVGAGTCTFTETLSVVETLSGNTITGVAARAHKKPRKKTVVIGSKTETIAAGGSHTVTVTLNGTGSSLLRKRGRLPVALTVKQGSGTVHSQNLTLTKPKRKHR
jgi:hypothetical protein